MTRALTLAALCAALAPVPAARAEVACTAISDAASGKLLKEEGVCGHRVTAASTFKIAISLMGYDSGFLKDEHSPTLPFREGYADWVPAWRTAADPASWIRNSVVWYSQEITKSLGEARFKRYVAEFHYGNEDVSGDPDKHDGLTRAWLNSSLKISPLEQLAFIGKIVRRQLPVAAQAYEMTSRIMALESLPTGWDIRGKSGTGAPLKADGSEDWDHAYGWFVGWATKGGRTLAFARLIRDDKRESTYAGTRARDAFLREAPSILDSL